jgi:hypothetical protein
MLAAGARYGLGDPPGLREALAQALSAAARDGAGGTGARPAVVRELAAAVAAFVADPGALHMRVAEDGSGGVRISAEAVPG